MENTAESLPTIVFEDLPKIMKEVTKEIVPIFGKVASTEEKLAFDTFVDTLSVLILKMFAYLPDEEKTDILINCGTWFAIGMLLGKSPKLLVEILNRVKPKIEPAEVPTWITDIIGRGRV